MTNSQKDFLAISLAILIIFLTFSNIFHVPFIYDDYDFLFTWKSIQSFNHLPELLMGDLPTNHSGVYRPARSLLYLTSYHLFHHNLFFYHLQSLSIYLTCIIFIYLITQKILQKRSISFFTAVFFGILPVHVDNVANLTASFDMLGLLFLFISFYCFQLFLEKNKHKYIHISLSMLTGALAFLGYEISLVLPFLIPLDLSPNR